MILSDDSIRAVKGGVSPPPEEQTFTLRPGHNYLYSSVDTNTLRSRMRVTSSRAAKEFEDEEELNPIDLEQISPFVHFRGPHQGPPGPLATGIGTDGADEPRSPQPSVRRTFQNFRNVISSVSAKVSKKFTDITGLAGSRKKKGKARDISEHREAKPYLRHKLSGYFPRFFRANSTLEGQAKTEGVGAAGAAPKIIGDFELVQVDGADDSQGPVWNLREMRVA
jgi:hypothetical protein